MGLDSGSTTTKAVLTDCDGRILWRFYDVNAGNPVELAVRVLKDLYKLLPKSVYIARAVSTGYGEALFQAALNVDAVEVETIAHYRAADFFVPGVEFLLVKLFGELFRIGQDHSAFAGGNRLARMKTQRRRVPEPALVRSRNHRAQRAGAVLNDLHPVPRRDPVHRRNIGAEAEQVNRNDSR